jgi:branched-chain amino acid aminotransferase
MADAGRVVSIDGKIFAPEDARVSVYDRGFLYGDAVFEVLRTYGGVPYALDEHLLRLRGSAERVAFALPVDVATLRGELERALAAGGSEESYVRIVLTRGSGPLSLDPDVARDPLRVILIEPVNPPRREAYAQGIAAVTVPTRRAVDETAAAGAKVANYLPNLLALRAAKSRGAQEALIVDPAGRVVEGASSNVFAVTAGRLTTPPESAGILAGITRRGILDAAGRLGLDVEQRELWPRDLYAAEEVFITSSIREVLPVVRVDAQTIGSGRPGAVTRALHRDFRREVGLGSRPMPWE